MKTPKIKLPFGLNKNNNLVHIADVKNGKECNCVCPSCQSPLIAAKGKLKQHHFRHVVDSECASNPESAIHMTAKKMIVERKQIKLPEYVSIAYAIDSKGIKHTERETVVKNGKIIFFDFVEEEKELDGMRADILAKKGETSLIIEIFYRHKVENQKIEKIKNENTSAIEINLSCLTLEDVKDLEAFWSYINDPKYAKWLHNVKDNDSVHPKLKDLLVLKIQKLEEEYKQEEIIKQRKELKEKPELLQALEELRKLRSNEHIAQLNQEAKAHPTWKHCSRYLQLSLNEIPDFLNVDVPDGDWIFGCDGRIWQAALYGAFICKNGKPFCIKKADEWLNNDANCRVHPSVKIVGIYGRRYPELVPADISYRLPSSWATLRVYFWHLLDIGMLEFSGEDYHHRGNEWFKVISKTPDTAPQYEYV